MKKVKIQIEITCDCCPESTTWNLDTMPVGHKDMPGGWYSREGLELCGPCFRDKEKRALKGFIYEIDPRTGETIGEGAPYDFTNNAKEYAENWTKK